jgi:hypothetical protein
LKTQIKEFRFNTYHKQYLSDPIHSSIIQFKQLETCIINIEVYVDIHLYITPNIGGTKYITNIKIYLLTVRWAER